MVDFATAHADVINATHRGFAFLIANGLGWIIAGILAHRWSVQAVATTLLLMGFVTMPLAFALRGWLGFPDYSPENPLNQLALLIAFIPAVAIPAVMAALLGGHFLPYSWLYQTNVYLGLGIAVAIIPSALM